jgi:hypothetical protein
MASLGAYRLHDDNFRSLPGGFALAGAGSDTATGGVPDASVDLLAPAGTAVIPLAPGTVIAAWPECDVLLIDHGGGTWVEYLHLSVAVSVGTRVTRSTVVGHVLPVPAPGSVPTQCGTVESTAPHIHFAFLTGSGNQGHYVSMNGRVLCGHAVDSAGDILGLGSAAGAPFAIPDCLAAVPSVAPPSRAATPSPTPRPLPPTAPSGLTQTIGSETTNCAPADPPGTHCVPIVLRWARPLGAVSGYKVYLWAMLMITWQGPGTPPPCGDVALDQTVTLPASATTYTAFMYGSPGYAGFSISAFNDAGASLRVAFPGSAKCVR